MPVYGGISSRRMISGGSATGHGATPNYDGFRVDASSVSIGHAGGPKGKASRSYLRQTGPIKPRWEAHPDRLPRSGAHVIAEDLHHRLRARLAEPARHAGFRVFR